MELKDKLIAFRNEIHNGLLEISKNYRYITDKVEKREYGFLYWILMNLYNVDEEIVPDCITEYNDKSIDCFVHYQENKELYILQCKYYDLDGVIARKDVSDFLQMPLTALLRGDYKKSRELQRIFNIAVNDKEYKIYFHFYSTSTYYSNDIDDSFKRFNSDNKQYAALLHGEFIDLKGIYERYYGVSYKDKKNLTFNLGTVNKGTFASLRDEYKIPDLRCEAYYIITPVYEIYRLRSEAKKEGYQLFEENIREFLGESTVNKGIIDTLRGTEKNNFLFYNNGITMICSKVGKEENRNEMRYLEIFNPQIVNGCQTVNSIYTVLNDGQSEKEIQENYSNVFVMVKVLVISDKSETDKLFYRNVVKFTNRQNSVPDKVFAANEQTVFIRIQKEFEKRGVFLRVKQSDKQKFDTEYKEKQKADMIKIANEFVKKVGFEIKSENDICIDLEKMLQVMIAYIKDGYYGYTKKSLVLKQDSDVFKNISINIQDYLSIDNMIKLYYLYKRAEKEQKKSEDKRTPIPYYVIGFISYHLYDKKDIAGKMNSQLSKLFDCDKNTFNEIYQYIVALTKRYKRICENNNLDYNVMIKQRIMPDYIEDAIKTYKDMYDSEKFNLVFNMLHNC